MRQRAVVIEVNEGHTIVETSRRTMCEGCHGGCSGGHCDITGLVSNGGVMRVEADNTIGAAVGDTVELETESKTVLSYAAIVFMLPIAVCMVLYAVVYGAVQKESAGLIVAGIGFVLTFVGISVFDKKCKNGKKDIKIVEIIKNNNISRE